MRHSIFHFNYFLDFHTHCMRHSDQRDVMEIVSLHPGRENPHSYFTIGHHPWWTEKPLNQEQITQLQARLEDPKCLALGEIGLDNLKGPEMNLQMNIVRNILPLAVAKGKPVIIHCVRAFDQLIQIKKEFPEIKKWCVHGYGRHAILGKQLIDQGFYLSLMPGLPKEKCQELFANLPIDRLFLETDSMPNTSIIDIYAETAALLSLSVSDLCQQMNKNAQTFFSA